MMDNCLEIGEIQSFLDGELRNDELARVSGHIAACDACSLALADAEDQSVLVFSALEREFDSLVPTQRLWNRINDSIEIEKRQQPFWKKAWALVSAGLVSPSMAAAASLLIVFGVVGGLLINRQQTQPVAVSKVETVAKPSVASAAPVSTVNEILPTEPASADVRVPDAEIRPIQAVARTRERTLPARTTETGADALNDAGYLPGEESYLKTIASLSRSLDGQKDTIMRPSERISYERNLAVVDNSIDQMRAEVKKDPRNASAKQVLYSSYQNKIDLLNSISQKGELVAGLN
jgi:anti-sigma factor RsiW